MSEHLEEDTKPDVDCLDLLSTDSQFGNKNKPTIGYIGTLTQNEYSADRGNDNAGQEETPPFKMVDMIKTEPGNDNDECLCVKTETEEYYNCEGENDKVIKQENCIDDNTLCKQESGVDDDTLCKQESGVDNDILCKQESGVDDASVKKEPAFPHLDNMHAVDH